MVTGTIPEPTTATLSLLALAGLAARRRRASR
ncbi:MAG: PEP-CTERM sorting domain-containing protein [Akkermansia sp.]|nr:PEP-CTERM sorting domain-containing protein [Akkermansia sp.]